MILTLMENNDLLGWGKNDFCQSKGNGTQSYSYSYPCNPIPFIMKCNVEQIEVGAHSCIVFCEKGVYVCGSNENGDLEWDIQIMIMQHSH